MTCASCGPTFPVIYLLQFDVQFDAFKLYTDGDGLFNAKKEKKINKNKQSQLTLFGAVATVESPFQNDEFGRNIRSALVRYDSENASKAETVRKAQALWGK